MCTTILEIQNFVWLIIFLNNYYSKLSYLSVLPRHISAIGGMYANVVTKTTRKEASSVISIEVNKFQRSNIYKMSFFFFLLYFLPFVWISYPFSAGKALMGRRVLIKRVQLEIKNQFLGPTSLLPSPIAREWTYSFGSFSISCSNLLNRINFTPKLLSLTWGLRLFSSFTKKKKKEKSFLPPKK